MKKILFIFTFFCLFLFGCKEESITIGLYDFDGIFIKELTFEEGQELIIPDSIIPSKEGYEFTSWVDTGSNENYDYTFKANYKELEYTVSFYDGDELIKEEIVKYNENAVGLSSEELTKEGYTFIKWDKEYSNIKNNIDIYAEYEINKYKVEFVDEDETLLTTVYVDYNKEAVTEIIPEKAGYLFIGWDQILTNIKSDIKVKAQYEIISYNISYFDGNTQLDLEPKKYNTEEMTFLPTIEKEGYIFAGWYFKDNPNQKIVSLNYGDYNDISLNCKWTKTEVKKTIELGEYSFLFSNINKNLHSSGTSYVYQPDLSNAPAKSVTAYKWSSSDETVAKVSTYSSISIVSTGYAVITGVLASDTSQVGRIVIKTTPDGVFASSLEEANRDVNYEVTFKAFNKVIDKQIVGEGSTCILPRPPIKKGYTFIGWDSEHFNINSDKTINAKYIYGEYSFVGKTYSVLGDSISTFQGYIPNGYAYFYPYPTADVTDVNYTWWMKVGNDLGMSLLKNNSWSGSCVSKSSNASSASNDTRLLELCDGKIKPDIILIFMGANDCGSMYVTLNEFTSAYKKMLDKIKLLCPETEIYLATLAQSGLYNETDRLAYNKVITDYALEYNLTVIDFANMYGSASYQDYVCDSIHPNKAGMNFYASQMIKDMLKCKGIELE